MEQSRQRRPEPPPLPARLPRTLEFALLATALVWVAAAQAIASRSAHGLAMRFALVSFEELLHAAFFLFLLVVGLRALDVIATRGRLASQVVALPRRATRSAELATGAAVGWGLSLLVLAPIVLGRHLHARWDWQRGSFTGLILSVATLAVLSLAMEVAFRGYAYRRLIAAVGQSFATVLMSGLFAMVLVWGTRPAHPLAALAAEFLFGVLLSVCWLRTHALWAGWGLHFASRAVETIVTGLPAAGRGSFGTLVDSYTTGHSWLSGGSFGPDAAYFTTLAMLLAWPVLYRATRDFAWAYTLPAIVPAGYEVTVAPPAAHVEMERRAAPPPLVQILPPPPPPVLPPPLLRSPLQGEDLPKA